MMHISCVVFEDKCHFRKTKQIRPPVPGVESRIRLARRSRAGPARSLKTHPSRTSQFGPRTKLACFSARGRGRRAGTTPRASSRTSQETQERRVQVSPSGTMRELRPRVMINTSMRLWKVQLRHQERSRPSVHRCSSLGDRHFAPGHHVKSLEGSGLKRASHQCKSPVQVMRGDGRPRLYGASSAVIGRSPSTAHSEREASYSARRPQSTPRRTTRAKSRVVAEIPPPQ